LQEEGGVGESSLGGGLCGGEIDRGTLEKDHRLSGAGVARALRVSGVCASKEEETKIFLFLFHFPSLSLLIHN